MSELILDVILWAFWFVVYVVISGFAASWRFFNLVGIKNRVSPTDNGYDQSVAVTRIITAFFGQFGATGWAFNLFGLSIEDSMWLALIGGIWAASLDLIYCVNFKHVRLSLAGCGIYVSEYETH